MTPMDAMLQAAAAGAHAEPFALSGGLDEDDLDPARRDALNAVVNAIAGDVSHVIIRSAAGIGTTSFLQLVVVAATSQADVLSVATPAVFACHPNTSTDAFVAWYAPVLEADGPRLLVLDDAAQLDARLGRQLCQAVQGASGGPASTTLVRAVRRRAASRLNAEAEDDDGFPPAELSVELAPLTTADVADLVRRRLAASGYHGPAPFTEDALDRVAYFGKGNPERVLRLCHHTFALALRDGDLPVTAPVVKSAAYELFLPSHLQKLARGLAGQGPVASEGIGSPYPASANTEKAVVPLETIPDSDVVVTGHGAQAGISGRSAADPSTVRSATLDDAPEDRPSLLATAAGVEPRGGPLGPALAWGNRLFGAVPTWRDETAARLPTGRSGRRWLVATMLGAIVVAAGTWLARDDTVLQGTVDDSGVVAAPDGSPDGLPDELADVGSLPHEPSAAPGEASAVPVAPSASDDHAFEGISDPAAGAGSASPGPELADLAADSDVDIPARLQRVLAERPPPRPDTDGDTVTPGQDRDADGAPGENHDTMEGLIAGLTEDETTTESPVEAAGEDVQPVPRAQPESSPLVADTQALLAELGYGPGPVDGLIGPRTRAAVRAFQRDEGAAVDGRITDSLVQRLRARKAAGEAVDESRRGRGLWSMLGFDLDSIHAPDRFYRYCRDNPDTWVYDHGKGRFVYCERFNARR